MALSGNGLRVPRGPLGFLAGLIDGLQPSMPAIQAQQQRRRDEAAAKKAERQRQLAALDAATFEVPTPEYTGDYERSWRHGVPEVGTEGPRVVSAPSTRPALHSGSSTRRGTGDRLTAAPGGEVGGLARLLAVGRSGVPTGRAGGRGGSQFARAGEGEAQRYARHLRGAGMPEALVQQLTAERYVG